MVIYNRLFGLIYRCGVGRSKLSAVGCEKRKVAALRISLFGDEMLRSGMIVSPLIKWRLAFGAGLPAAMHPQPLVWIATDVILDHFGKQSCISKGVGIVVAGAYQGYRGIE